jgi:hypothetical protein
MVRVPPSLEEDSLRYNSQFDSLNPPNAECRPNILFTERILDERKSMFPYTDEQAQRFMQVYRDLKSK